MATEQGLTPVLPGGPALTAIWMAGMLLLYGS
jgi:hypothetical protein